MKFAFQKMRLEADSYRLLISSWADMLLTVTEDSAIIRGYGFCPDIAEAFSNLMFDWEATIHLSRHKLSLDPGEYGLVLVRERLYASNRRQSFRLADQPVVVEVESVELGLYE